MEQLTLEQLVRLKSLGLRVTFLRRRKGWSQEELASKCGSSQSVIQKIENEKSKLPRIMRELARALECDPQWLLFGNLHNDPVLQYAIHRVVSKKMPGPDYPSTIEAMRETMAELIKLEQR